jgi:hypothetical protein
MHVAAVPAGFLFKKAYPPIPIERNNRHIMRDKKYCFLLMLWGSKATKEMIINLIAVNAMLIIISFIRH